MDPIRHAVRATCHLLYGAQWAQLLNVAQLDVRPAAARFSFNAILASLETNRVESAGDAIGLGLAAGLTAPTANRRKGTCPALPLHQPCICMGCDRAVAGGRRIGRVIHIRYELGSCHGRG